MRSKIIEFAREAGRVILTHYRTHEDSEIEIIHKADDSPLTRADQDANDLILSRLKVMTPDIPVISEEAAAVPFADRRHWTKFWLVDPLDGTKEFIKRNGEFTVNIALIDRGIPVLGVVYAPAIDLLYEAERGVGSFRTRAGGSPERCVSEPPNTGDSLRVVTSRSHASNDVADLLPGWPIRETIPTGSSLKFCLVADGTADVYPRGGPTMEWDVGAGDCIYRNSGRGAERPSPLTYNKPDLRNPAFVVGIDF